MKKVNKETLRMQMLAGIITEGQYKAKLNEDSEFKDWSYNDDHGTDIVFKSQPLNPNDILTQHDEEYIDPNEPESEHFTKKRFWETDIVNHGYLKDSSVIYATKSPDGTWKFSWDSGEISGFKEGEDFDFIKK